MNIINYIKFRSEKIKAMSTYKKALEITPAHFIKSAKVYGRNNVLVVPDASFQKEEERIKKLLKASPNSNGVNINYFGVLFKYQVDGEDLTTPFRELKVLSVPAGSKAKKSLDYGPSMTFKPLTLEEIRCKDYADDPSKDSATRGRTERYSQKLYENNLELIEALDIIDECYQKLCADIKKIDTFKLYGFHLQKEKSLRDAIIGQGGNPNNLITINRFKTTKIEDKESGNTIQLDQPFYRIKFNIVKAEDRALPIGTVYASEYNYSTKKMIEKECIYDALTARKNKEPELYMYVNEDGDRERVNKDNVDKVVTRLSGISGKIAFDFNLSTKGFSMKPTFKKLVLYRHSIIEGRPDFNNEELDEVYGSLPSGSYENVEEKKEEEEEEYPILADAPEMF